MRRYVEAFIREHQMLEPGSRVVVGVSGGADSICLLDILCDMRRDWRLELSAVHVHHGLRGEGADRDERCVRQFCEKRQVFCKVYREQVRQLARDKKKGLEEAGRDIRYLRFEQWRRQWEGDCIAVAHHQDDQAETVLFQLARGSGLKGAGGIRPVNGHIIRPLLCAGRRDIRQYLVRQGISWCEDETNAGTDYARNRIRHHIFPLMEEHINDRASAHLAAAALEFQEAEAYIAGEEKRLYTKYVRELPGGREVLGSLLGEVPFMRRRVLYSALKETAGSARDLSVTHVKLLDGLLSGACGRRGDLPYGVRAWKEDGRLLLLCQGPADAGHCKTALQDRGDASCDWIDLTVPGDFYVDGKCLTLRLREGNIGNFPRNQYTKWLDCDKIAQRLVLRKRRPGDRITIDAAGHHKKLKDYLIDRKIPRHKRDGLWLVAEGSEILWIIGERMGEAYRVTGTTKRVLEMQFTGDEVYE